MSHKPNISLSFCALLLSAVLPPAGQAASGSPPKTASAAKGAAPAQKPDKKTDVCALLTRAEIQVVQSEPVEEILRSAQPSGGRVVSVYFSLHPTSAEAGGLRLVRPPPSRPPTVSCRPILWRQRYP